MYRSWAIPCAGPAVYRPRHRSEWLAKIVEPGVRLRAERPYQQLDALEALRQGARRDVLAESQKHRAVKLLRQIHYLVRFVPTLQVAAIPDQGLSVFSGHWIGFRREAVRNLRGRPLGVQPGL